MRHYAACQRLKNGTDARRLEQSMSPPGLSIGQVRRWDTTMTDKYGPWWPSAGGPWSRWRASLDLEDRREAWTGKFFDEVSRLPDAAALCELESPPGTLRVAAQDEVHGKTLKMLNGSWLAVKVCARRLPADPISTGLGVLEALEGSIGELRDEASRVRPTADDRAPDGGRWFPWALAHPESGMDESEAARRDFEAGRYGVFVDKIDEGLMDLRRGLRRARWTALVAHFLPLAAMAAVIAVGENLFSVDRWWVALMVGVGVFLIVDRILIVHVVEPMIDARQRRILDGAAHVLEDLGLGALAAGLSRRA